MSERQNDGGDEAPLRVAINDVRYWRDCARRMRAEAHIARDPRLKRLMRDIAERYIQLALDGAARRAAAGSSACSTAAR